MPIDLTNRRIGATPLWLLEDGSFAADPGSPVAGMDAVDALVAAARWVSSRRAVTFERLFPPDPFHPERARTERLTAARARGTLAQAIGALAAARIGGEAARSDAKRAGQARSAALTILSHLVATVRNDPDFRGVADAAAEAMIGAVRAESDGFDALRVHGILLLQLRGPALNAEHQAAARALLRGLVREAPPYAALPADVWRFAMCSAWDFHAGLVDVLEKRHRFRAIEADRPGYEVLVAPVRGPGGQEIRIYARTASPETETREMADPDFQGLAIHRHAQLGSYDMRASSVDVRQQGYKLLFNSQCAGLTTRFAITRMFPDADVYSSWDSTYFVRGKDRITSSEGIDCLVALLEGFAAGEPHARLSERMRAAQWAHEQKAVDRDFVQFVGPSHPAVVARFSDLNQDGRADRYDGFLDLDVRAIAEDVRAGSTPRDPGVPPSAIGGEAARGLNWAAGSLNRVTRYSDLWAGLPGAAEQMYPFEACGFYSHLEPPDGDDGRRPAVVRYLPGEALRVEVSFHAWLSHAPMELKRLLVAAEAVRQGVTGGWVTAGTPLENACFVLLTLAGLLEYPADQNNLDALWAAALRMLDLPEVSRSAVRDCITSADHDNDDYYGSKRGLKQLAAVLATDPVVRRALEAGGRARSLA